MSIDTLRSDRLPFYGYGEVETPALTRLRQDSILFQHAYSHIPLTPASARFGLLPGCCPLNTGSGITAATS